MDGFKMEVYVVKENVQITPVVSKTKQHNSCTKEEDINGSGDATDFQDDCTLLTLSDIPVTLMSICSHVDEHSEQFAKKMEEKLTKRKEDNLGKINLKLTISNDTNSHDGYFTLDGPVFNKLRELDIELDDVFHEFSVELSLCHLPTANAAISSECLIILQLKIEAHSGECLDQVSSSRTTPIQIPPQMKEWREQGTGFIYSKFSLKLKLKDDIVNWVYNCSYLNARLMLDKDFTDLEIECENGEIVKCHRAVLASESDLFRMKFKEMLNEGRKVGPWKLKMEMSKEGVEALLEYIYCGSVSRILDGCDVALEVLKVDHEHFIMKGWAVNAMNEIIMAKDSTDFEYFSLKSALDMFLYARKDVEELKHLRDKAVHILQNYLKTASDKILESKEYQDLFKNQPQVAMELSSLYIQLSMIK